MKLRIFRWGDDLGLLGKPCVITKVLTRRGEEQGRGKRCDNDRCQRENARLPPWWREGAMSRGRGGKRKETDSSL